MALVRNGRLNLRAAVDDAGVEGFFDQLTRLGKVGGGVGIKLHALGFLSGVDALGQAAELLARQIGQRPRAGPAPRARHAEADQALEVLALQVATQARD